MKTGSLFWEAVPEDAAEEAFRGQLAERFELLTGDGNQEAKGFYEHLGFLPSGEVHWEEGNGTR